MKTLFFPLVATVMTTAVAYGQFTDAIVSSASGNQELGLNTGWASGVLPTDILNSTAPLHNIVAVWDDSFTTSLTRRIGAPVYLAGLRFESGVSAEQTINNSTTDGVAGIYLGGAGITVEAGSADVTIAGKLFINANQTWTVGTGSKLIFSTSVANNANTTVGSSVLTLAGAGTFQLSHANAAAFGQGKLVIGNGVRIANTVAVGLSNSAIEFAGNAYLGYAGTKAAPNYGIGFSMSADAVSIAFTSATRQNIYLNPYGGVITLGSTQTSGSTITGTDVVFRNEFWATDADSMAYLRFGSANGSGGPTVTIANLTIGGGVTLVFSEGMNNSQRSLTNQIALTIEAGGVLGLSNGTGRNADGSLVTNRSPNETIGSLSGAGMVTPSLGNASGIGNSTLTIDGTYLGAVTTTFSGQLTDIWDNSGNTAMLGINKLGASTQILTGANYFGGGVTAGGGTLTFQGPNASVIGAVSVNGGTTTEGLLNGGVLNINSAITTHSLLGTANTSVNAGGTLNIGATGSFANKGTTVIGTNANNIGKLYIAAGGSYTSNGNVSINPGSTFANYGTFVNNGTGFSSNAALLIAGANNAFGAQTVSISNGSTIRSDSKSALNFSNGFYVGNGTAVVFEGNASMRFLGDVTWAANQNKLITNNLGAGKKLTFAGTVNLGAAGDTSARSVVFNGEGHTVVEGVIQNGNTLDMGLTYNAPGILELQGTNTYTGATTVSSGTLLINGSVVAGVTVANVATLGGSGTIGGTTTVNGTFNGDGATFNSGLTFSAGATWNLTSNEGTTVKGLLETKGNVTLNFVTAAGEFKWTGADATNSATFFTCNNSSFDLLDLNLTAADAPVDPFNSSKTILDSIGKDANGRYFFAGWEFVPIPEPSTWLLLGASAVFAAFVRRKSVKR